MELNGDDVPSLDRRIGHLFYRYAIVVYRYRWLFLLVPCFFAAVLALGFYFRPYRERQNSVETFTPTDGHSHYEKGVINGHWPLVQNRFIPGKFFSAKHWIQIVVWCKGENSNVLTADILNATEKFNTFVMDELSVWSRWRNRSVTYRDLCLRWVTECYDNGHITLFQQMKEFQNYIQLSYPIARSIDTPLYLGTLVAGVKTNNESGTFDYATHLRLSYNLKQEPFGMDEDSNNWKIKLQNYVAKEFNSPLIDIGIWHGESINQGLKENVYIIIPDFGVSYTVLAIFCTITNMVVTYKNGKIRFDWVLSKPFVAFMGVFSSALAVVISMGFLLIVGMEYVLINAVMPILAISVGVSDMFIMVSAWWETDPKDPTEIRLGHTLSHAGVAITITSVTDVVSFLIGAWSSFPAVTSFCIYTALAMMMDYVCQITFFAAVMAFFGDFEAQRRHCYFFWRVVDEEKAKVETKDTVLDNQDTLQKAVLDEEKGGAQNKVENGNLPMPTNKVANACAGNFDGETLSSIFFTKYYRSIIFNPYAKAAVCALYFTYAAVGIWGCLIIDEGLRPADLVHSNHYVVKFYRSAKPFRDKGMQAHIVVSNPPNLTLSANRQYLMEMVKDFESGKHSLGSNATVFFLKEYLYYLTNLGATIRDVQSMWTEDIKDWIRYTGGRPLWDTDIIWSEGENGSDPFKIEAFRFQIGLLNFDSAGEQVETANFLRETAEKYCDLNVSTYHEYWPHVDQYITVTPTTWRNLTISFISMTIIAFILIPNFYCCIFITLSMLSINMGVYGYMSHWGVSLDCISMITLIMSIGFAVDLTAHISYGYVCAKGSPAERASFTLQVLGVPVFLSAMATLLGILILGFAEVPLIVTFFKTVFLVMVLGLLHSHLFLPVALTLLLPDREKALRSTKMLRNLTRPFEKIISKLISKCSSHVK